MKIFDMVTKRLKSPYILENLFSPGRKSEFLSRKQVMQLYVLSIKTQKIPE